MAFEDYDQEFGYSISDLSRNYSKKAYNVPDYDINSLEEIERYIKGGKYAEKSECDDHIRYLEGLQKGLAMIRVAEERDGIMNWELREVLDRVRKLIIQLSSEASHLPGTVVYEDKVSKISKASQLPEHVGSAPAEKSHMVASYSEPLM